MNRFHSPVLQTFVVLDGLPRGLISREQYDEIQPGTPTPGEQIEPPQLF